MNKQKLKIDIVSDINCPWCYVGDQRLKKAMKEVKDSYDFEVSFKPFELNPNIPQEGMTREEYFLGNYGPDIMPQLPAINKRLEDAGNEDGIRFNFDKLLNVNNTFNGHRLIWLAGECGVQEAVADALFKSYFTDGENMNDPEVLTRIGMDNGILAEKLENFFNSEAGKQEVSEMEAWAKSAGITGVPAFIINDKYLVSGAQPAETLLNVFKQVAPALEEINLNGDSCDVNGNC